MKLPCRKNLNIAMVSDFFFPNMGGVENHIYQLSVHLAQRGHKVIVITHSYGNRKGVRYFADGIKIYYIPSWVIYNEASIPIFYGFFPILRNIAIREQIDIFHGHGALSSLCHEALMHSKTMNLKAIFTEHSLYGFSDTGNILTNKLLTFTLSGVDHVICVSHTSKENTVLRAVLNPSVISVIPNAIVAEQFKPDPSIPLKDRITIIVNSRLVYRKGIDLLIAIIPVICNKFPNADFIISGDGNKRIELEQMRESHLLQDRVELLGAIQNSEVRSVLVRGQIFLNTSLTEAFCIGILEAACAGLLVVSTRVGGVPEVLPENMVTFAQPEVKDLVEAVSRAIQLVEKKGFYPWDFHEKVKSMYSWTDIAERTEKVYCSVLEKENLSLLERLERHYSCGAVAGKIFCIIVTIDYFFWLVLEWLLPAKEIDIAPAFTWEKAKKQRELMSQCLM